VRRTDRRPRQRLGERSRREAILRAAGAAFAAQPYPRVSVAGVAAAAGASEALVHRYFGSKTELYLAVLRLAVDRLLDRQRAADAALGPDATPRDRLAASIRVYLAAIRDWSPGWTSVLHDPSGEPAEAAALRHRNRDTYLALLREVLAVPDTPAVRYALHGYLGFLTAATLAWAERGHPGADEQTLVTQSLAALEAALEAAQEAVLATAPDRTAPARSDGPGGTTPAAGG
jgi:AcrR family transcriptional regulator